MSIKRENKKHVGLFFICIQTNFTQMTAEDILASKVLESCDLVVTLVLWGSKIFGHDVTGTDFHSAFKAKIQIRRLGLRNISGGRKQKKHWLHVGPRSGSVF